MYILSFIIIILLIFTNAITDAPNAIATLVGTKVISFKKAAKLSAICNLMGIITMSFVNISVANCISTMINLEDGKTGIIVLISGMSAVIIFAQIALKFGIPTSETHGLIAGLTGSSLAVYSINAINFSEWKNIIIGLIWSVLGTYVISVIVSKTLKKYLYKKATKTIEIAQLLGCMGMSFMHGAQDGQKFIGVLIIFTSILNKTPIPSVVNPLKYTYIIIFVAIIMAIGVSIGGKKIVENIGSEMIKLNNTQALLSDISTIITLFIASMTGLPVSTTHAKTISIIGIGRTEKVKYDRSKILNIVKAWIWTFPVCGGIAYIIALILQ